MPPLTSLKKLALSAIFLAVVGMVGCPSSRQPSSLLPLSIALYSGVENVVRLGDSENEIRSRFQDKEIEKIDLSQNKDAQEALLSHGLRLKPLGIRAYFRQGRVVLLEFQEPFQGDIKGKRLKIFPFEPPKEKTWNEILTKEFGEPTSRLTGGRLGSEALLYSWGDLSFNAMGPNEIALYRQPELRVFRQKNFGRVIQLFNP